MEILAPSLLPILLREHNATNSEIALLVGTLASVLNMVVTPIVSVKSDRHRGPNGRRIPFLFWPTPLIAILLAAIPFAPEATRFVLSTPVAKGLLEWSPVSPVILVFGLFIAAFQLVNMVVASVYYYLFKDVVPEAYLGRFLSLFRVFGSLAGFVFNYFIFGLAESHMREIFIGVGALYGIGFLLMCWKVKEGTYPPPPPYEKGPGVVSAVRTFFVECFRERIYLWVYAARTLGTVAGLSGVFSIFFLRDELGFNLDPLGKLGAWQMLAVIPLAYPFGILVDRWKPMRAILATTVAFAILYTIFYFYITDWNSLIVAGFLGAIISFLYSIAIGVWIQSILPGARYGQFASAMALVTAVVVAVGAPLCGMFFDWVKVYRFHYLWFAFFMFASAICLWRVYRHWLRHGGPAHYVAP